MELPADVQKIIVNKNITKYIIAQKEKWNPKPPAYLADTSTPVPVDYDPRQADEMLSDDIRDLGERKLLDSLIERLPRGIKEGDEVKYNLYEDFKRLKDKKLFLKNNIENALTKLIEILKSKKIKYSKIKDKYNLKKQERNILAKKFNKYKDNLNECQLRLETIILERNQLNEQLSRLYNDYNILQKKYNLLRPLKPINIDKKVNLLDLSDEEEEIKQPVFLLTNTESYDTDMISSYIGDDISKLSIDS